jgi:hypothetical protein
VDVTDLGLCPIEGFGFKGAQLSGSATTVLIIIIILHGFDILAYSTAEVILNTRIFLTHRTRFMGYLPFVRHLRLHLKHRKIQTKHPCHEQDTNPRSQHAPQDHARHESRSYPVESI